MTTTTDAAPPSSASDAHDVRASLISEVVDRPHGVVASVAWWLTRALEPIGYAAATAIGLGLWVLLGDYLAGLSDLVTVALLVVCAVVLWWAAWSVGQYDFAETWRLGNVMYAVAIATSGWVGWVATESFLAVDGRVLITAVIVTVGAFSVQRWRGDLVTYVQLLVGVYAASVAGVVTLTGGAGNADPVGSVSVGVLVATAIGYVIAGQTDRSRRDATIFVLLLVSVPAMLNGFGTDGSWRAAVAATGFLAAAAAYRSVQPVPRIAVIAAATHTVAATLVALSWIDWDFVVDAVPLPILLVLAGSTTLAALAWATRRIITTAADPSTD